MTRIVPLVMLMAFVWAEFALAAESPVGKWNTIDDKSGKVMSEVEIYEQGGKLFGKITALADPNDAAGKPKICTPCEGADKNQPVVGLIIIRDLVLDGDSYTGGTLLDPDDGKIYDGEVWLEDGKLKVRGYLAFFYRTQTWVRAK